MIESTHNETFQKLVSLTSAKGLKEEGLFLLSGEKLIREFLADPALEIVHEIITPHLEPLLPEAKRLTLAASLFKAIDVLGTSFNILVLKQPVLPVLTEKEIEDYRPRGIELVVPIGDPGNLGAVMRSAEAFGVPRVILTREAAHPFLPKAVKASAGSVLRLALAHGPALAAFPASCITLDTEGVPIDDFAWPEEALLLVGEEGPGFSKKRFPQRIRIPTVGVESLNVVVAASIALARLPKRR